MGVLTVLHVAAVLCFSWSWAARWTGLAVMPLMAADIAAVLLITYWVYAARCGKPNELFVEDELDYRDRGN